MDKSAVLMTSCHRRFEHTHAHMALTCTKRAADTLLTHSTVIQTAMTRVETHGSETIGIFSAFPSTLWAWCGLFTKPELKCDIYLRVWLPVVQVWHCAVCGIGIYAHGFQSHEMVHEMHVYCFWNLAYTFFDHAHLITVRSWLRRNHRTDWI